MHGQEFPSRFPSQSEALGELTPHCELSAQAGTKATGRCTSETPGHIAHSLANSLCSPVPVFLPDHRGIPQIRRLPNLQGPQPVSVSDGCRSQRCVEVFAWPRAASSEGHPVVAYTQGRFHTVLTPLTRKPRQGGILVARPQG